MDSQLVRLISDNPNINNDALARIAGVSRQSIGRLKRKLCIEPKWIHCGIGLPFVNYDKSVTAYQVRKSGRRIHFGSFELAMVNLDRLIYCLENNNGKLPSKVFDNMEFIGRNS